ncbi:response regulator transcription factor [Billgrantia gudaonensis]|uniref:Two component transcriptional regulator, LuxR family n=1 Tax=Billgrantia gudaonensis TaxID=376427 RepID=A0A1G8W300_9GAMM|nr:response regulator transcription factor [Halomonas gudaonensis]SDJ72688.1 two component transcriptional regulator, LuxR family [Halomonas gudaonensis]
MPTLMVADDHPLFREAIAAVIDAGLPGSRMLETDSLESTLHQAERHAEELDLLLLDLGLPDADGLAGLARLRQALPRLPVAIVSAEQDRRVVLEAIDLGAVGYIPKSTPREALLAALQRILEGQVYLPPDIMRRPREAATPTPGSTPDATLNARLGRLTDKQLEVLERMTRGESNKRIALALDIAETTVKTHVSAILRKLEVASRVQAILVAGEIDLAEQIAARRQR